MKLVQFVTGSRSYNLHNVKSDYDFMVVECEPFKLFELNEVNYRQTKTENSDYLVVSLRDYLRHLHKGNAAYVQTLFNRRQDSFGFCGGFVDDLRNNALNFLNAENVHKSFTGVAVRMYKEYVETGNGKSACEAMRYLFLLQNLHVRAFCETYVEGFTHDFLYDLKFGNRTLKDSQFQNTLNTVDGLLVNSALANNTQEFANKFSVTWYTKVVDLLRQP